MTINSGERIQTMIANFVLKYNYWGYLFSRIRRTPNRQIPSIMGVAPEKDGSITLYYHPDLVANTDDANLRWIITHEGMHLLNKHVSRLLRILANEVKEDNKKVKADVFNIAADCSVNKQCSFPQQVIIDGKPWPACHPEKYGLPDDAPTELYYLELLKNTKITRISMNGGSGKGEDGESPLNQPGGMDDHKNWVNNVSGVADISSLSRKVEQTIQNTIRESVKSFNKDRGTLPGHIASLIEQALRPPQAPYYQIIRKLVRGSRLSKFKRSHTKINRKRGYVFALGDEDSTLPQISPFPGRTRDYTFNIVIVIDTSGSMSDAEVAEGLSGVKSIIEKDRHCYTTVLEVDTVVEKEYECKKIRDIQFNIKGRGGTTLYPGLERANQLHPDVVLVFTDGGCENINTISRKKLPKKIIWVISKGCDARQVNRTGFIVQL